MTEKEKLDAAIEAWPCAGLTAESLCCWFNTYQNVIKQAAQAHAASMNGGWLPITDTQKDGKIHHLKTNDGRCFYAKFITAKDNPLVHPQSNGIWFVCVPLAGGWGFGTDTAVVYDEDMPTHYTPPTTEK